MKKQQKRILAINDISCFGKCSLTVAIPLLSAAGMEVCPIPTAMLSTHTGGFSGYTLKNLDDQILPVTEHWKSLGLKFDAIYSGYLASYEQLEYVKKIIADFAKEDTLVFVDPVMGDNGVLYKGFTPDFSKGMRTLCKMADIIVPNVTEAAYMLSEECKTEYTDKETEAFLKRLSDAGMKKTVITGIPMKNDIVACGIYDNGNISFVKNRKIEGMYHGTGDVFASALLCADMHGAKLESAVKFAADFVYDCIFLTHERYGKSHYGVDFESLMGVFTKRMGQISGI